MDNQKKSPQVVHCLIEAMNGAGQSERGIELSKNLAGRSIEPPVDMPAIDYLKIDHQKLIADIIASDDGREPMDKARHNMADPTPLEVLDFVCAGFDDIDMKIHTLVNSIRYLLMHSALAFDDTTEQRKQVLEVLDHV